MRMDVIGKFFVFFVCVTCALTESCGFVNNSNCELSNWYPIKVFNGTILEANDLLTKRMNTDRCVPWVDVNNTYIEMISSLWEAIWDLAVRIKQRAIGKDCNAHCGHIGAVHYKFWNAGGDCDTTAQVKTIAGAIDHVLKEESGQWLCNTYCMTMKHGGALIGYLKISVKSVCGTGGCSQHDNNKSYDSGCGSLDGSCSI